MTRPAQTLGSLPHRTERPSWPTARAVTDAGDLTGKRFDRL